jgi:hypothetical protein
VNERTGVEENIAGHSDSDREPDRGQPRARVLVNQEEVYILKKDGKMIFFDSLIKLLKNKNAKNMKKSIFKNLFHTK